jgi:hypothetical protein
MLQPEKLFIEADKFQAGAMNQIEPVTIDTLNELRARITQCRIAGHPGHNRLTCPRTDELEAMRKAVVKNNKDCWTEARRRIHSQCAKIYKHYRRRNA